MTEYMGAFFMKSLIVIILCLFAALFVGLAGASDTYDVIESVEIINDAIDAIDITLEGAELVNKQLEDPTNTTLLTENLVEMTNNIVDPENIGNQIVAAVYFELFYALLLAFAPIITFIIGIFH
jgi:hypothetical protein